MILLDTHIFVWLTNRDNILSEKNLKLIDDDKDKYLSIISCWEISLLLKKERIRLKYPFRKWIDDSLNAYDIKILDLDLDIIFVYHELEDFHNDPADKLIAASSISKNIPLFTFDKKLLEHKNIKTIPL